MTDHAAVIFDLDGVLVDTVRFHYQAWQRLAEKYAIEFSWSDMVRFRGRQRRDCLLDLLAPRSMTETEIEQNLHEKNDTYLDLVASTNRQSLLLPGVPKLIQAVQNAGLKMGVASSSVNAVKILKHVDLFHLMDIVADGNTVVRSKPAPDIFLWAAGAMRTKPTHCIVFEDSQAGIEAGIHSGMYVVGVGEPEFVGEAHVVISTLEDFSLDVSLAQNQSRFRRTSPQIIEEM